MRLVLKTVLILWLLAVLVAIFAYYGYERQLDQPLPVSTEGVVDVPSGSGYIRMLNGLRQQGLLGEGWQADLNRWVARLHGARIGLDAHLQAGEYRYSSTDSLRTLLDRLQRGEVIQRSFTLVEGWTFRQVRERLQAEAAIEQTLAGLSDEQVMARLGEEGLHPEGWFAPETYLYARGTSDLTILRQALQRQQRLLAEAWENRQPDLPYRDAYEALIMASIVERETGVVSERGEIAGVFVNRLRRGMRLQTDPTVIYGMGEDYQGRIRRADLRRPTPYNTYVISGLPPTPIAMPGLGAILATLAPESTRNLYFVARGDGSHQFSRTLSEHNQAVRRYQLQRREDYRSSPAPEGQ